MPSTNTCPSHAQHPFDEMPRRPILHFNSIIRAPIIKGSPFKSLHHFKTLVSSHPFRSDARTFSLILKACHLISKPEPALQIHARFIKTGYKPDSASLFHLYLRFNLLPEARHLFDELTPDPVPGNLLVTALMRNGQVEEAKKLFEKMPLRDFVSWNSLLSGLAGNSRFKEGLGFFRRMISSGIEPDGFSFSSVLSCCARTGSLNYGEWVHKLMVENGTGFKFMSNPVVVSALIDMYAKCGCIEVARRVFDSSEVKDQSIYNVMMTGLAVHGYGTEATELFVRMEEDSNITPDGITFVGLLTALSHSGLVEPARFYFDKMKRVYAIEPMVMHCASMIDGLARAGLLDEALETIEGMTMEPDDVVWRSFLSGCKRHQRMDLAEMAIRRMSKLGSGDYVLILNIYSSVKHFDRAERVWDMMRVNKVRKEHGVSWVEFGVELHQFKAGSNQVHPDISSIHQVLTKLTKSVKEEGFVPMIESVAMDVDEEEKEENLMWHSEKIAVAYSVLRTGPGMEIRVSKNLTTCGDCHEWMKGVSKVLCRVIVVRDRLRFHRFDRGVCWCGDYW